MTKNCVLLDNPLAHGFEAKPLADGVGGVKYVREMKQMSEIAFCGQCESTLRIEVTFNPSRTSCLVYFYDGGYAPFKQRVYGTVGKRTWNAIVETARCKSFEI